MILCAVASSSGGVFQHQPLAVRGIDHPAKLTVGRTSREVISAVLSVSNTKREALMSPRRDRRISRVRHVCMYLLREVSALSLAQIGKALRRDETTVFHACRRVRMAIGLSDKEIIGLINAACIILKVDSQTWPTPLRTT